GLFADIATGALAPGVAPFAPMYALWSDGTQKQRYVLLSGCIDTSDMDHWSLPVGTKLFKTFIVDGIRVETRMIGRFGHGGSDFIFAAYQWRDDQANADHVPLGVNNANGTQHDIPSEAECKTCHGYLPERALGFSAIQLSHDPPGVTIDGLVANQRLSVLAPA